MLPHNDKKPGCGAEIMEYFRNHPETGVTRPDQIAIVGDRLTTDVLMANLMGSYAVWVKDGVVPVEETSFVSLFLILMLRKARKLTENPSLREWSKSLLECFLGEDMKRQIL